MLEKAVYSFLRYPHYLLYGVIFFLMIFLGEEFLLIIGALSRLGFIDFWDTFFVAFLGTVAGDIFWYKIGERYGEQFIKKYGRWFFMTPKRFEKLKYIITDKGGLFIFASKFMYSMNHISEVAAGAIRFNFKKYLRVQILVSAIWSFGFISLGYFFAHNLNRLKHDVTLFTIVLLAIFVVFILLDRTIEKLLEKRFFRIKNGNEEETNKMN